MALHDAKGDTHIELSSRSTVVSVVLAAVLVPPTLAAEPHDDLTLFISKYCRPDRDVSSENERPRPPIVTRQLIYKKEDVRAVYVPDAPVGSPPPYKSWKLMGFQAQ